MLKKKISFIFSSFKMSQFLFVISSQLFTIFPCISIPHVTYSVSIDLPNTHHYTGNNQVPFISLLSVSLLQLSSFVCKGSTEVHLVFFVLFISCTLKSYTNAIIYPFLSIGFYISYPLFRYLIFSYKYLSTSMLRCGPNRPFEG
jgi:hypothetical protein